MDRPEQEVVVVTPSPMRVGQEMRPAPDQDDLSQSEMFVMARGWGISPVRVRF